MLAIGNWSSPSKGDDLKRKKYTNKTQNQHLLQHVSCSSFSQVLSKYAYKKHVLTPQKHPLTFLTVGVV